MFGSSRGISCDSVASCYIYDNLVRCLPILSILSRNILHGIGNKQMYTAHHISILCVPTVPCKNEQRFLRHTIQHQIYATPHIAPGPWPLNSSDPDLIPFDYKVSGVMQERVYCTPGPYSTLVKSEAAHECMTVA